MVLVSYILMNFQVSGTNVEIVKEGITTQFPPTTHVSMILFWEYFIYFGIFSQSYIY